MSQNENSYLQKYLKKLNPTIEIKNGPDFRRPRMVRSLKPQSIELGPKEAASSKPSLLRVARVRSSTNKCRQELHVRPTFDEPENSPYLSAKPKLLDPLIPQPASLLPSSRHKPENSSDLTSRRSILSNQWSLSSVSIADNPDESDEDDLNFVQRSLTNIRGSARQRKMARSSQLKMHNPVFKAKTPQREKRNSTVKEETSKPSDLSVLDILSQKRKQSREKMKVMIGGQYWLLKPLSNSSSSTSTETAVSSKVSSTKTEEPEIEPKKEQKEVEQNQSKARIRVVSQKQSAPEVPGSDVEIRNLYRFNPDTHENPFGKTTVEGQLTGNGSSTYPGFELIESKAPSASKPVKLTGTSRNFAVQGSTIAQSQTVDESADISPETGEEKPEEERTPTRNKNLIRRPKSLPVQRTQYSFMPESPVPNDENEEKEPEANLPRQRSTNQLKNQLTQALEVLPDSKAHWETTIENLHNIRDIARDNSKLVQPRAVELTNLIIHHCNNIRSRISGAAIDVLSDVFNSLRLILVPCIEPAIKALMSESGKENVFIREKCEKCFQSILEVMCDSNQISAIQKLISTLFAHTKSKNSTCRVLAAQCLEQAVLLAKPDRCLSDTRDITDKIMSAMINAVNDSAGDARYFGRRIVNHLAENEAFERRCKQYLNGEDIKRINAIKAEGLQSLQSKSITKLKVARSTFSQNSPKKSVSNRSHQTMPGLKEELNAASKSTSVRDKVKSLELMKQCIKERGSLGNEMANGCDILCSMIKSAATANHRAAIEATDLFIPLIKDERVLVTNLLKVLVEKISSSKVDVRPLLDQISRQCHPTILLPFFSQQVVQSRAGRKDCCRYLLEAAGKLKTQKPSFVTSYTKSALWTASQDRSCFAEATQMEELLESLTTDQPRRGHNISM